MSRLFHVQRPEDENDLLGICWLVNHNCEQAKALRAAVEDENLDLLQFSVGIIGYGMPLNVPFEVISTNECGACGKSLRAWFAWSGPRIWVP